MKVGRFLCLHIYLPLTHFLNPGRPGSVNTLEEVAASSSKDEYVGKRKAGKERKEDTFICNTFDDQ